MPDLVNLPIPKDVLAQVKRIRTQSSVCGLTDIVELCDDVLDRSADRLSRKSSLNQLLQLLGMVQTDI